jgi:hypothetical protein
MDEFWIDRQLKLSGDSKMASTAMSTATRIAVLLSLCLTMAAPAIAADEDAPEISAECRAFRADADADLGDLMRAGCEPTLAQMSALMDNPLGNVAMWINQVDWYRLNNDQNTRSDEDQVNYTGILQFPVGISEKWNTINRVVYSVPSSPINQGDADRLMTGPPSQQPGGGPTQPPEGAPGTLPIDLINGRTTGFGDLYYIGLLSPKQAIKHESGGSSVWGVGLDASFPTATEDLLGSGRYSMGPSALYAYLGPDWKLGGLLQSYFDFAGDDNRDSVTLVNLQLFYYYSLSDTMSIGAGPNIIANFEAASRDTWTVPIGWGINRTFQFGKLPVRIALEYFYSLERPDTVGSDHNLRLMIIPAVPSALLPKWMQGR